MNFKQIETFLWVSKLLSFSKTAQQQCTTQPAISSRIAALEAELGVTLFERDRNNKVILTTKGHELLPYAEKIIYNTKEFTDKANQSASFSGVLRIGVSETVAYTWLSEFMERFQKNLPDVLIELTVDVSTGLSQQLTEGLIDIAFLLGPLSISMMVNEELTSVPLVWVASPDLDINKKGEKQQSLEELSSKLPVITYAKNTLPYNEISRQLKKNSKEIPRIFSSTSLGVCRQLVLDGRGIGALPTEIVKDDVEAGKLDILELNWTPSNLNFTASFPMTPHKPQLQTVIDLAKRVIADRHGQKDIIDTNT
ncbi:LysR family transcriptional regulator [Cocleimonas flava]|uniref:DNA-binding transcriptional LysR family regulator n=1 Tax=Cocleimonas flava TaxID=634765 RepID=A0A4R1F6B7_9GAMM|nr:LysR family transcriptional regulator [Cocleimonas flava]TCJ87448.1 DNA-binding transcriptional LysR family regulator [Cocleimonas flava]